MFPKRFRRAPLVAALFVMVLMFARVAFAQDEGPGAPLPPPNDLAALYLGLVTAIVPLVLAGVRSAVVRIPSWVIPIAAPFLGAALDVGLHYSGVYSSSQPLAAAFFGMAGVGLREIVDQLKKSVPPGSS